jgi:hypothetical protein
MLRARLGFSLSGSEPPLSELRRFSPLPALAESSKKTLALSSARESLAE